MMQHYCRPSWAPADRWAPGHSPPSPSRQASVEYLIIYLQLPPPIIIMMHITSNHPTQLKFQQLFQVQISTHFSNPEIRPKAKTKIKRFPVAVNRSQIFTVDPPLYRSSRDCNNVLRYIRRTSDRQGQKSSFDTSDILK